MTTLIRGGTIIDAERTYRADVLCADPQDGGTILQIGADLEAPAGAHDRRCGRAVRDARRHRSAHAYGIAVHGHDRQRRLLYRHRGGPVGRHDEHHRLRDPEPEAAADGCVQGMARLGREGIGGLRLSRRGDVVGRIGVSRHGHAGARSRRIELQALHGLQERDHGRRRSAREQLHAFARTRRAADRACGKRRTGVSVAEAIACDAASRDRRRIRCRGRRKSKARRRIARSASRRCSACRCISCTCRRRMPSMRSRGRATKASACSAKCCRGIS